MTRLFFTSGSNEPSGGGRVLNEVVQLAISRGVDAVLCLPRRVCKPASFVSDPAPVLAVEEMAAEAERDDVIICGWHSREEYEAVRTARVRRKVFWQHGTLIPIGPTDVGEQMFEAGLFDQYWNVSRACAEFICEKYGIAQYSLVPPFFVPYKNEESKPLPLEERSGILVQQRRGVELLPDIRRVAARFDVPVTLLEAPFRNEELLEKLNRHRFFVSFDRGLRYMPPWLDRLSLFKRRVLGGGPKLEALFPPPRWVPHKKKMLGFPVTAAQAACQGSVVIGFAMGGGLEWMTKENVYLAQDGDGDDLCRKLEAALTANLDELRERTELAAAAVARFGPDQTWEKLSRALELDR